MSYICVRTSVYLVKTWTKVEQILLTCKHILLNICFEYNKDCLISVYARVLFAIVVIILILLATHF